MVIEGLSKSFDNKILFSDFSFEFKSGEKYCIVSPSGTGKTTFLRIIMGLEKPDLGKITGNEKISCVFQEDALCEQLGAIDNVKIVCPRINKENIAENLKYVGISGPDLIKPVVNFSGGMKRRCCIVRAIMASSDMVIMDEPFNGIDYKTKTNVVDYIKNNLENRTFIFVSHLPEDVDLFNAYKIIL